MSCGDLRLFAPAEEELDIEPGYPESEKEEEEKKTH